MSLPRVLTLLAVLGLAACTSRSVDLNYYMLHSPQATQRTQPDSDIQVVLTAVQLPDYLQQRQLALQTSDTTLQFSSQHVWATPQDEAIRRLITSGLRQRDVAVFEPSLASQSNDLTAVTVSIDDFIPTWQGELILKGEYLIRYDDKDSSLKSFDYRTTLQQDGFAHSVAQMRELVDKLSQQISDDLR